MHHKLHFPQITSAFRHSHNNMVRSTEERFAMERMATRGLGSKKIAEALGVPLSTTQRWRRRLRSDGDMTSSRITSDKHVPLKNCGGRRNVALFLEQIKAQRRTSLRHSHLCVARYSPCEPRSPGFGSTSIIRADSGESTSSGSGPTPPYGALSWLVGYSGGWCVCHVFLAFFAHLSICVSSVPFYPWLSLVK